MKYVVCFPGTARSMGPFYTRSEAEAVAADYRVMGAYVKLVQFDPWA